MLVSAVTSTLSGLAAVPGGTRHQARYLQPLRGHVTSSFFGDGTQFPQAFALGVEVAAARLEAGKRGQLTPGAPAGRVLRRSH